MAGNIGTSNAIREKNSELKEVSAQKQRQYGELSDDALIKDFMHTWSKQGYQAAVAKLPKDNPRTIDLNESISEEKIRQKIEKFFKESIQSIDQKLKNPKENVKLYNEYLKKIRKDLLRHLAGIDMLRNWEGDLTNDIKFLRNLQKSEISFVRK